MATRTESRGEMYGIVLPIRTGSDEPKPTIVPGFKGICRFSAQTLESHFKERDALVIVSTSDTKASITFEKVSDAVLTALENSAKPDIDAGERMRLRRIVVREVCDRFMIASGKRLASIPSCRLSFNKEDRTLTLTAKNLSDHLLFQANCGPLYSGAEELLDKVSAQKGKIALAPGQYVVLRDVAYNPKWEKLAMRSLEMSVFGINSRLYIATAGAENIKISKATGIPFSQKDECLILESDSGMVVTLSDLPPIDDDAIPPVITEEPKAVDKAAT